MRLFRIGLFCILIFLLFSENPFAFDQPEDSQILRTDPLFPGMKGYCLTTLRTAEFVRIPVEILSATGSRSTAFPFHSGILIRVIKEELPSNWTGLSPEMAGSPVYINDKLIGALCTLYEWSFPEIAQVRPIEEMLLLDDFQSTRSNQKQSGELQTLFDANQVSDTTAYLESEGGKSERNFEITEKSSVAEKQLKPGDSVAAMFSIGDYTSYVKGNIYAFGKSVFNRAGAINAPLVRADVLGQMFGFNYCVQVVNPGLIVGTIQQDRASGIYGKLGVKPDLIPVETVIHDVPYGKAYHALSLVLKDKRFYPNVIPDAVAHSIGKQLNVSWEGTIDLTCKVTYTINGGESKTFSIKNMYYSMGVIGSSVEDLRTVLSVLAENDFSDVSIQRVDVDAFWTPYRETGRIESAVLQDASERKKEDDKFVVEHGEEVTVIVSMRHYKREPEEQKITFKIDDNFPTGAAVIQIRGGGSLASPADYISDENFKMTDEKIKNRLKILEPMPPSGLEQLLSSLPCNEPYNRRIVEIIASDQKVKRGEARFSQSDSIDMDMIVFGFETIPVLIKD
jgi:hypothetical protein